MNANTSVAYGRGYVYKLIYHIVWCTYERNAILVGGADALCDKYLHQIAQDYKFTVLDAEIEPDYIHIVLDCKPQFCISDMVKIMKGSIAKWLYRDIEDFKHLYGKHIWNTGYFAVIASDKSLEQVQAFLATQGNK